MDLLSRAVNQVACQIGSAMTPAELLDPCNRLDPYREPGKLTLIVRMGAGVIADRLPALARAVRDDGHPALWLSDPMHGNTIKRADGGKTRAVSTIVDEVSQFLSCLDEAGLMAHGVHLEASPYAARECVWGSGDALPPPAAPATGAPTLCDPRLDAEQAAEVVSAWWRAGYAHPRPF